MKRMAKRSFSITRRLTITLTAVVTVFWLMAAGFGMMVMQDEFTEIFDSSLKETGERLMPLVVDDLLQQEASGGPRRLEAPTIAHGEDYLIYQVRDSAGSVILHSHDATQAPFDAPLQQGFHDTSDYRIYTAASVDGSIFVQIADAFDHRSEAMIEGGFALLLPLLILLPASIFAIRFTVRRLLSPIDDLRLAIGTKDGGNMAPVERETLPRELQPIAHSVNLLLTRLRAALEAEREFTANSAHELRTPIAGALAQTQRLVEELPPGALQGRARQVETSLGKLARLSEKLLQLSRAEAGIGGGEPVDLSPILSLFVEDARRSPLGQGRLNVQPETLPRLERPVNADAFAIVVRNLVENALLHSPPDSPVEIELQPQGVIRILNRGAALAPDVLAGIRSRFSRGPTTAAGSGLGLAIVSSLVEQMNGELQLLSPPDGRRDGFEARIVLTAR